MKKKEGMVPRVEVMHGFRNMEFHLSSPNLNLSALDSNTESLIGSHSTECLASCLGSWLIILFCFHHGKGRFLFLLEQTCNLYMGFPSLHPMFQPKQPSVFKEHLIHCHGIPHSIALKQETNFTQKKYGNGLMFMEFPGHTRFPIILKQLV